MPLPVKLRHTLGSVSQMIIASTIRSSSAIAGIGAIVVTTLRQCSSRFRGIVISPVSSPSKQRSNAEHCPSDNLSVRGQWCHYHGCPGPKCANASGSRRRMTPLGRSDPVLRFVRSRQRFVSRCHGTEKAPTIKGRGKLSRAECDIRSSALPALPT
jgi:hypothetical protein